MRHLVSVALAVVLTPLIYISAGFSAIKINAANELGQVDVEPAALGLAAAFLAGGLYALLVMARLSPIGPFLAGLAYLGVTLWSVFDERGFRGAVPDDLFGQTRLLEVPAGFGTALLAVPLLITIASPARWRATPSGDDGAPRVADGGASPEPSHTPDPTLEWEPTRM